MAITLNGTTGITTPALDSEGNLEYSGTLTGGTGVINIGSGQVFKDASGNVGIGTSSPASRLHISGVNVGAAIDLQSTGTGGRQMRIVSITGGTGGLAFEDITANAERARIDASGGLLVGCTSTPNASTQGFGINVSDGGGDLSIVCAAGGTGGDRQIAFFNPNGMVGSIVTGGSATSFNTSSDYRLKEDVQPVLNPIDRLMQLKPINFAWKVDGSRVDGFLAHEAQEVVPEAVTGTKDAVETVDVTDKEGKVIGTEVKPVHQGIDQSKLVPLLTAAIQEQQTLIQALTARIEALEQA